MQRQITPNHAKYLNLKAVCKLDAHWLCLITWSKLVPRPRIPFHPWYKSKSRYKVIYNALNGKKNIYRVKAPKVDTLSSNHRKHTRVNSSVTCSAQLMFSFDASGFRASIKPLCFIYTLLWLHLGSFYWK